MFVRIPSDEVFIKWSGPSAAREWTLGPKSWVHAQSKEPSSPRRGNPFPPSFDDTERHPGSSAKPSCRIRPFGEQTTGAIRSILRQGGGPRMNRIYIYICILSLIWDQGECADQRDLAIIRAKLARCADWPADE